MWYMLRIMALSQYPRHPQNHPPSPSLPPARPIPFPAIIRRIQLSISTLELRICYSRVLGELDGSANDGRSDGALAYSYRI